MEDRRLAEFDVYVDGLLSPGNTGKSCNLSEKRPRTSLHYIAGLSILSGSRKPPMLSGDAPGDCSPRKVQRWLEGLEAVTSSKPMRRNLSQVDPQWIEEHYERVARWVQDTEAARYRAEK
ncbi:hypothetical protein BDW22DRAFT_1483038 [Trametopsis cervina]|nr:hypothetical protein BDW22DRAFT_1483038 [Trametopsis cervina]